MIFLEISKSSNSVVLGSMSYSVQKHCKILKSTSCFITTYVVHDEIFTKGGEENNLCWMSENIYVCVEGLFILQDRIFQFILSPICYHFKRNGTHLS